MYSITVLSVLSPAIHPTSVLFFRERLETSRCRAVCSNRRTNRTESLQSQSKTVQRND